MFNNIDKKFAKIDFIKVQDDKYGVRYERHNSVYNYNQVIYIGHKENGNHIIMSYDKNLCDSKNIGNTAVGLSYYEAKLALKKMKSKHWKSF